VSDTCLRRGIFALNPRSNLDLEIPDGQSLEATSRATRSTWSDKLDLLTVSGATPQNRTVLYTSVAHTLVYPYSVSENLGTHDSPYWAYYSGYLDRVLPGISYSGYSIWDTFRAQTAWLIMLVPERAGAMITSMLQDYKEGGWMPMWKNIVETNIMVGTHSDAIIAQAMQAGGSATPTPSTRPSHR
jgi:putative alpha-1,2-mannosidase